MYNVGQFISLQENILCHPMVKCIVDKDMFIVMNVCVAVLQYQYYDYFCPLAGKSSLCIQFVDGQFVDSYDPTIENTFTKKLKVGGIFCLSKLIFVSDSR